MSAGGTDGTYRVYRGAYFPANAAHAARLVIWRQVRLPAGFVGGPILCLDLPLLGDGVPWLTRRLRCRCNQSATPHRPGKRGDAHMATHCCCDSLAPLGLKSTGPEAE
eukprot:2976447-Pyramimonas_sp.AAC.2